METERKREFIIKAVYFAMLAAFFWVVMAYGLPLLAPFVVAFFIAYILRGPTKFIHKVFRLPYKPVALLLVLLVYGAIGLLLTTLTFRLLAGVSKLIEVAPHIYNVHLLPFLNEVFVAVETVVQRLDPALFDIITEFSQQFLQWLGSLISGLSGRAVSMASGLATSIPALFIKLVLMIIASFFIAGDYEKLTGFCMRQMSDKTKDLFLQIKKYLVGTLFVCIGSYIAIMSLTFVELSIGLSIIGVNHAFLIAGVIAVFDVLPVLGTGGIMIPWGLITIVRGNVPLGLELLLVYVIITVIRNIVEPKIVGSQLGLHPVVTLASMFAGVQLFGVVGLFGFPIALSLLLYLNNNGSIHILKAPPKEETDE